MARAKRYVHACLRNNAEACFGVENLCSIGHYMHVIHDALHTCSGLRMLCIVART